MWKRIHSNRDPRDTVFSELSKRYRPFLKRVTGMIKTFATCYPKSILVTMILSLLLSIAYAFTQDPVSTPVLQQAFVPIVPVQQGFEQLTGTTARIIETMQLRAVCDSLLKKQHLDPTDSLLLNRALDRIRHINKH